MSKRYEYHTEPFDHQREVLNKSHKETAWALFLDQGTGKTKIVIDNAAWAFENNLIDALLIVADNGIHRNWITDEIPKHLPPRISHETFIWQSSKAGGMQYQAEFNNLLTDSPLKLSRRGATNHRLVLKIFAMNTDAIITKNGSKAINEFLKAHRCMMAVDESTSIKTPGARRSKTCVALGKKAVYRRILTGTPATESPFDLWMQFNFLDPTIIGIKSFYAFKAEYGIWEKGYVTTGGGKKRDFPVLTEYRNLDKLINIVDKNSSRVLKKDCLDLPPKLYQKRYFELGKKQRRLYNKLREEFLLELTETDELPVTLAITRILRLQQIRCGCLPDMRKDEPSVPLGENAALKALKLQLDELPKDVKVIIWGRFTFDIDEICKMLGDEAVRYDGKVKDDLRAINKKRFQEDDSIRYFVGKTRSGGKGLDLWAASVVIYYSNEFSLEARLQSEDRAHRHGSEIHDAITYIDLQALDTVDEKIITSLRTKKKLSDTITKDPPENWL